MCLAVPMKVLSLAGHLAQVDQAGVGLTVSVQLCDEPPRVGDYVIVHAGFAIHRLDPAEAQESLRLLALVLAPPEEAR
jgi:hydrogenase expression/formation protein HypC